MSLAVKLIAMMGESKLIFRSAAVSSPGVGKPSGVAVGDLVFVAAGLSEGTNVLTTSGGDTWAGVTYVDSGVGQHWGVFWKILNATDVANSWALDGGVPGNIIAVAYESGAATVTQKGSVQDTGSSAVMTAFTPSGGSKGAFAVFGYYGGSGITDPADFTQRADGPANPGIRLLDNFDYGGGSVTETQTGGRIVGFLFEVV